MLFPWLITNIKTGKELNGNVSMLMLFKKKIKFAKLNSKTLKKLEDLEAIILL